MPKLSIVLIFFSIINNIFGKTEDLISEDLLKYEKKEYINFFKVPDSLITSTTKEQNNSYFKKLISFLSINYATLYTVHFFKFDEMTKVNRILINLPPEEECIPTKDDIRVLYSLKDLVMEEVENFTYNRLGKKNIIVLEKEIEVISIEIEIKTTTKLCENKIQKSDIEILQPESEKINSNIMNIFDKKDYRMLTLSKEFNKKEFITNLESESKRYKLSDYSKRFIERIKSVYYGDATYDPRREFTTNKNSASNILYQRGNVDQYARSTLRMTFAGTNRQSTGIYAKSNETITIFAQKGNPNDPLPSIRCTQHLGHWRNWLGKTTNLKEGEQTITVDDFKITEDYTLETFPGGPIYLMNPYTSEEQSQDVSIYIEGGNLFPVFRLDEDEDDYRSKLLEATKLNQQDKTKYFDITEMVGIRTMMTMKATDAYNKYVTLKKSPQENLQNWDIYIKKLLIYDGIQFDKKLPYYNEKNNYVNINFRYVQPYGGAYAYTEHIGIFSESWINSALYLVEEEVGWGFPHEIGHMMDIGERTVSETSNNMIAKYSETYIEKDGTWGPDREENKILYLTPDNVDPLLRGCQSDDISICKGFLTNIPLNYLVFWDLESIYHGYWGQIDNMYRYNLTSSTKMTKEEKFVYFSNVILGFDLGYYFTRWGLSFSNGNSIFDESKTSSEYKELMQKAINANLIDTKTKKKYWYLDYKEYNYMNDVGLGCYQDKDEYNIQIIQITYPERDKHILTLPKVKCPGHLGFEIYENNKIIGFTYDYTYTDEALYISSYNPKYKIVAYDRLLDTSKESETITFESSSALKQINLDNPLNEEE